MLRRLAFSFAGLITTAIAIAACSSSDATTTIAVGPTFGAQTLYAANVSQNAINIYPSPKTTGGPAYQIGGGNTSIAGPQYIAFDSMSNLYVTNWLSSTSAGLLEQFKADATGSVIPYQAYSYGSVRPRGIADAQLIPTGETVDTDVMAVGVVDPSQASGYTSGIDLFQANYLTAPYIYIAGPATQLNVPSGLAFDSNKNLYVTNLQGASVTVYALGTFSVATASPTPTGSPTTTPSPSPTPVNATPTPTVTTSPFPLAPTSVISGAATLLGQPTGIAIDSHSNIWVADQSSSACTPRCAAVLEFAPGATGSAAPAKTIAGANTLLSAPTDVKVDNNGNVFVADSAGGTGVVYEWSSGTTGNVAPTAVLKSPGALVGLALVP